MGRNLFVLSDATIERAGGEVVLRGLNWTVRADETWAIVGPSGAGKTTLAELLLGKHHLVAGSLSERPAGGVKLVSFREESWLFSPARHYYQQRFNFIELQDDLDLGTYLRSGSPAGAAEIAEAATRLGLDKLLYLSLIKLSSGQMRRARIARALLARPGLLILDDPFVGLDVTGRADLVSVLGGLIAVGTRVLLICRREDVPLWVTHTLELKRTPAIPGDRGFACEPSHSAAPLEAATGAPIIELKNVHVRYGDRLILRGIDWRVRAGERWALLGPNGSGKTTLLSLLCGDHPQAYANDIRLFGRQRGSGESIWEIKRNIGLVSPELHVYFTEPLSAAEAAATGFFDVLVRRRTTAAQSVIVRQLFEQFGLAALSERPFARLSTGEQRLVLLIRALVKAPPLLILDEPFQGLDTAQIARARNWLEGQLTPEQALLFVTHYPEEIPRNVTRVLRLHEGSIVEIR